MSGLIGNALPQFILTMKDRRLVPDYQHIRRSRDRFYERSDATQFPGGFASDYWPGNRGFIGDAGADYGITEAVWSRGVARLAHGVASRVGFVGVTRDQYGAPLGGVTCSLFKTDTRAWIMDVVSDADGAFLLQSVYSPDTHFIVFYKAGSPEVFGTTRQALVGA